MTSELNNTLKPQPWRQWLNLTAVAVMALVWALLVMVVFEWFPGPLLPLHHALMPWRGLMEGFMQPTMLGRIEHLERIMEDSKTVGSLARLVMFCSFMLLVAYTTVVFQHRQRRMRENELLMMKNQEIARRNEFIRYISATIGHEFKNNLGRIKRRLDLMGIDPQARARIDENFLKLFADIDIFKQIASEREAGLIEFESLDLAQMLDSMKGQYSDMARISCVHETAPPRIYASRVLIRTVFENLIDNSIKYKKPSQSHADISFICSIEEDSSRRYVTIRVRDEGVGMDDTHADRCFYERKSTSGGWGEGLYFVKYVIGLHAGKVRIGREHTAPGKGTEIIINLPYVEESVGV